MRLRRWTARVLESVAQTRRVFEAPPRRAGGPLPSARPPPRPRSLRAAGGGPEGLRCLPERGARSFPPAQCPERASPAQHCPQPHVPPTLAWATSVRACCHPPRPGQASPLRPCRVPLPRAPLRAGASFPHPHRLSTQLPDSAAPQPPTGRLRPAELAQAACRCSFSPGASKGAGARDVHVLSPSCCGRAQGFVGNDTFYYWFGAFSGHFKLAFLSESQYAGYKFQQGLMTRGDARKNRLEILKLHVP